MIGVGAIAQAETLGVCRTESGTGWLEKSEQGNLILHLEGTYYDMGFEQGKLLGKECLQTMRGAKAYVQRQAWFLPYPILENIFYREFKKSEPFMPEDFKQEIKGLADAGGVPIEEVQALHMLIYIASCSATAAFGPATKDGQLYQTRSLDFILTFIDPETKVPLQNNSLIVVYQPKGEVPFVSFSWPGVLGSVGGMNAKGISVSEMSLPSKYETPAGLSMIWRIKQTLSQAENLDQAISLMTQKPLEGGYLYMVGDGNLPSAVAIEMDAKNVYVGGWDGPAEKNSYRHWGRLYKYEPKPGLIVRTNHPLSAKLIADYPVPIDLGKVKAMSGARYRDLKERDLKEYGSLDLERMMQIMREHYQGMCPDDHQGCPGSNYQAVFAPKSGDFLVSFAYGNPNEEGTYKITAWNQPYHRYNFYDLMKRQP